MEFPFYSRKQIARFNMKNHFLRGLASQQNSVASVVDNNILVYGPANIVSVIRASLNSSFKHSLLYKRRIIWAPIIGVLFGVIFLLIFGWGIYILLRRLHIIHHPRPANFEPFKEPKIHNSHYHIRSVLSGLNPSNDEVTAGQTNSPESIKHKIESKVQVDKKSNPLANKRNSHKHHGYHHEPHDHRHHYHNKHRHAYDGKLEDNIVRKNGDLDNSSESKRRYLSDEVDFNNSGNNSGNNNNSKKISSLSRWLSSSRRNPEQEAPENFIVVHSNEIIRAETKLDARSNVNKDNSARNMSGYSNDKDTYENAKVDIDDVNNSGVSLPTNLTPQLSSTSKKFSNLTSYHSLVSNCHISSSSSSAKSFSVSSSSSSSISIQLQDLIENSNENVSATQVEDVEVGWDTIFSADESLASAR